MEKLEALVSFLAFAHPLGSLFEIRVLENGKTYSRTAAGLFDDPAAAAAEVMGALQRWPNANFYYTLNPIDPRSAYAPCAERNKIKYNVRSTAKDADILGRNLYLVDLDPCRQSNVASTALERKAAKALTIKVRAHLSAEGWPEPTLVSSGNGYHLLYRGEQRSVITGAWKLALAALADRFDTPEVNIDRTVYNSGRIARLPWTVNRKGPETLERPHRKVMVLKQGPLTPVSDDQVSALLNDAKTAVQTAPKGVMPPFSPTAQYSDAPRRVCTLDEGGVDDLIRRFPQHLVLSRKQRTGSNVRFHLKACPFKGAAHQGQEAGKTTILWSPDSLGFKCFSDDCSHHTIDSLLSRLEAESGEQIRDRVWQKTTNFEAPFQSSGAWNDTPLEYLPGAKSPIFQLREVPRFCMYE